jgi:Tol biopolymer transport system component
MLIPLKETALGTKKDSLLGTQITFEGRNVISDLSTTGTQLLFSSSDRISHSHSQIYNLDLEALTEKRLTFQDGQVVKPFWFMDKIIYSSTTDEIKERPLVLQKFSGLAQPSFEIYQSDIEGTEIERLTDRPGKDQALGVIRNQIYYFKEELGITSIKQLDTQETLIDWEAPMLAAEYSTITEAWLMSFKDQLKIKHRAYEISVPLPFKKSNLIESRWSHSGRLITVVLQNEQKHSTLIYSIADECFKSILDYDHKITGALFLDSKQQLILSAEKDSGVQIFIKPIEMKQLTCLQL